jgi:hypothetical protein
VYHFIDDDDNDNDNDLCTNYVCLQPHFNPGLDHYGGLCYYQCLIFGLTSKGLTVDDKEA